MSPDFEPIADTERPPPARPSLIVDVVPLKPHDIYRLVRECGVDRYRFAMLRALGYAQLEAGMWIPGERSRVWS